VGITIRLFRRRVGAIGRTGRDFVAELSREARAGPLGAQLERAVILLEILWNFENRVYPLYRRSHLQSEFAPTGGMAQIGRIPEASCLQGCRNRASTEARNPAERQ
jgi:hypothetical protein